MTSENSRRDARAPRFRRPFTLNEQVTEVEYLGKKQTFVNRKAELKGLLEGLSDNCRNRFEPAIRFVKAATAATLLVSSGNQEQKRDFLKKIGSNLVLVEKSLALTFKNPWNLAADFTASLPASITRDHQVPQKSNWRREGDSNSRCF